LRTCAAKLGTQAWFAYLGRLVSAKISPLALNLSGLNKALSALKVLSLVLLLSNRKILQKGKISSDEIKT
jgi:hypothetical protein